ncbi:hypothetical protein KHHGKMAE_1887 [Methylobacterium persicinum]|nr:hypothetical protein KHHGKMAE_1887 [Methylobacterium persicinum]
MDDPECCFVCRRRADGLGVMKGTRVGWLCQQCTDGGHGMRASRMPVREFDRYEQGALRRASQGRAGAYLDSLGRTDLALLHPEEWQHVCRLIVEDFGAGIRAEIGGDRPAQPDVIPAHQAVEEAEHSEAA